MLCDEVSLSVSTEALQIDIKQDLLLACADWGLRNYRTAGRKSVDRTTGMLRQLRGPEPVHLIGPTGVRY